MLLPNPGPAGSMSSGNKLPANWRTKLNRDPFGGVDLTQSYTLFRGNITQASDGTPTFGANVWGQNDGSGGNPSPSNIYNETRGSRTFLVLKNLELAGNVLGGGTTAQVDAGTEPGLELVNCKVRPVNAPAMNATNPEDDTSYTAANGGLRGVDTSLVGAVSPGATTVTVNDKSTMNTVTKDVTAYIGPNNSAPDAFNFTSIVQNGDLTWTLSGCTGIDGNPDPKTGPNWAAGTQIKFGCDRDSGRIVVDNVVWGNWTNLWMYYGGDSYGDAPCIDFTGSRPAVVGDYFLDRFFLQNFTNDGVRFAGQSYPCKNVRMRRGSAMLHPGAWLATNVHSDMFRVKQMDNSALDPVTQPWLEWVFLASLRGNAGMYINDPQNPASPTIKNLGVRHCLFSLTNKMGQLSAVSVSGFYVGYSWAAKNADFSDSFVDNSADLTMVEFRDDSNNMMRTTDASSKKTSATGPDDGPFLRDPYTLQAVNRAAVV